MKNASIYLISTVISFVISILVLPVYTRLLTPSEFGITLLFIIFGKIVVGFVNFSLHGASYRYYFDNGNDEQFRMLNSTNFFFLILVFFITSVVIYYTAFLFSSSIYQGQLTRKLIVLSLVSAFIDYLSLYMTTLLTAQLKAAQFAVVMVSNMVLNSTFSLFFIIKDSLTFLGRVYGILLSQAIIFLVLIILCRNTFILKLSYASLKKSLRLTSPYIPQMFLGLSQNYLDKSVLSASKGTASLGFYSVGVNFATVLKMIMDAVEKTWTPFFMKNAVENSSESINAIVERFYSMAVTYMFLGLGVIYFSEEAIKLLTTKEFYPAILITPVYVYFYMFAIVGYLTNCQLSIAEKLKYVLPGAFVGAVVNIILNFILIPQYGAIGAAVTAAVTSLISQLFLLYYGMKAFPLPLNNYKLLKLYIVLIVFTAPAYILFNLELNFVIKVGIKLIVMTAFLFSIFTMEFIDTKYILSILNKNRLFNKLTSFLA